MHMYICIVCIYVWMHACMYVCMYVCVYKFMFGCMCMNACVMSIPDYGSAVMHNFCVYVCVFVFVCVCLFPLCFCHSSQSEERKRKESKGKERDGMRSSVFSILYVLLGTCLCNVLVQIMKEVFNHHSTPHSGTCWQCGHR